jgi:hypothetical protein
LFHSDVEWERQKYFSAFEQGRVVGARRTGLSVSRTATLLGFSRSTVSCVYQEWFITQRTSIQLDPNVGSIQVNMGQHSCGTLSTPCSSCKDKLRLFKSRGLQLNISKMFLVFGIPSVYGREMGEMGV